MSIVSNVAYRFKLAVVEMPQPGRWTIDQLEAWHAQTPKPRSIYDKFQKDQQPFGWATPAPSAPGIIPKPWRVSHADRARDLLKRMFPEYHDLYVDYESDTFKGKLQLWIGLRDNRNAELHAQRTRQLAEALSDKFQTRLVESGRRVSLYLVDDLRKDVLK